MFLEGCGPLTLYPSYLEIGRHMKEYIKKRRNTDDDPRDKKHGTHLLGTHSFFHFLTVTNRWLRLTDQ